jgi:hypothetical protein
MQRWSKNTARVRDGRMGVHPCCNSDLREDAIALTVDAICAEIASQIYDHALIRGYGKDGSKPSYLASHSFRNALLDVTDLSEFTSDPPEDPAQLLNVQQQVEVAIGHIPNEQLRTTLLAIWHSVDHDVVEFRGGVDRWFDTGMERVSGWYKRRAQVILFGLGMVTAVVVNANTLTAADRLEGRRCPRGPRGPGGAPTG